MGIIIELLLIFGIGFFIYWKYQDEKRKEAEREAERQANRKACIRCGRIHYSKIEYCPPCAIELYKKKHQND